eukprot:scaffold222323_cov36-Cyclotella_meneghiniana.AAC.1
MAVRLLLDCVDGGAKDEVGVIVHDDSNINDAVAAAVRVMSWAVSLWSCMVEWCMVVLVSSMIVENGISTSSYVVNE